MIARAPADQAEEPSDADLVARAQGGDTGAFVVLAGMALVAAAICVALGRSEAIRGARQLAP